MDEWMDLPFGQESAATPSNQTSRNDSLCFIYDPNIVPALYFLIFPIALLLNSVAAWVSLHLKSTTTFVVYLKNLVAADLIMTLIIPIKAVGDLPGASNRVIVLSCRFFSALFYSTLYTCITLLGLISLDRFFKITTPHSKLFGQNLTFSKLVSASIWLILFGGTALPNMILSNESVSNTTEITTCMQLKGPTGLEFHSMIVIYLNAVFWLVSVVVVVCYICIANKVIQSFRKSGSNNNQGKKKIKLRVFLVVILFFVLFGPYHAVRIPYTFHQVHSSPVDCTYLKTKLAKDLSLWLATMNICLDPLLYVFLCREFKEKLISLMKSVSTSFQVSSAGKAEGISPQSRF